MAWCQLHDIDTRPSFPSVFCQLISDWRSGAGPAGTPLYYAALCGFPNVVEQLISKHPQHVNAIGGYFMTPAVAALAGRHFELAEVLHRNGSSVDPRGRAEVSTLHSAAWYGDLEMAQVLLDYGVDINAKNDVDATPLHFASHEDDTRIVLFLLDHGADLNIQTRAGSTPLHQASRLGKIEIARILVEHGAGVEVQDEDGRTPLDVASEEQHDEVIKLLLEHRSK